jgi:hypothetical protein
MMFYKSWGEVRGGSEIDVESRLEQQRTILIHLTVHTHHVQHQGTDVANGFRVPSELFEGS